MRAMFLQWGATPCGGTTQGRRDDRDRGAAGADTRVIEKRVNAASVAERAAIIRAGTERRGSDLKLSGTATPPLATLVALVHARRRPGDGGRAPGRGADRLLRPALNSHRQTCLITRQVCVSFLRMVTNQTICTKKR
jgi:hypothetical protein